MFGSVCLRVLLVVVNKMIWSGEKKKFTCVIHPQKCLNFHSFGYNVTHFFFVNIFFIESSCSLCYNRLELISCLALIVSCLNSSWIHLLLAASSQLFFGRKFKVPKDKVNKAHFSNHVLGSFMYFPPVDIQQQIRFGRLILIVESIQVM